MKPTKGKIIAAVAVIAVLAEASRYGDNAPGLQGWTVQEQESSAVLEVAPPTSGPEESIAPIVTPGGEAESPPPTVSGSPVSSETPQETDALAPSPTPGGLDARPGGAKGGMTAREKMEAAAEPAGGSSAGVEKNDKAYSETNGMEINSEIGKDKYLTDPVPEGKPLSVEPQDVEFSDVTHTCTLFVRCDTILDNMDWLDPEKVELIPEDGVMFPTTTVTFYEGESVSNMLQREMWKADIYMEFEDVPMYNSTYIEGINNLYELDCGELSGWMYKVNRWFPNYGCSRYQLKEGDIIEWICICDLGVGVGGFYSTGERSEILSEG